MGKKKSVVLMTLITIVIVVLSVITAFPAFTLPGTNGVKKWNPAVLQYDMGCKAKRFHDGGYVWRVGNGCAVGGRLFSLWEILACVGIFACLFGGACPLLCGDCRLGLEKGRKAL